MYSEKCNESDKEYIIDKLVAYNLSKVKAEQQELFIDLSRKFVREGKIIAGIIAQMYCWNMVYVDTLWVDSESRGKGLGYRLLTELEDDAKKQINEQMKKEATDLGLDFDENAIPTPYEPQN